MTQPLTAVQASRIAAFHEQTIRRCCENGSLPAVKHGHNWMIAPSALEGWMDGRNRAQRKTIVRKAWARR